MLTLTPTATEAIKQLTDQVPAEDATPGVRIAPGVAPGGEGAALELSLVEAPESSDQTIETHGATVYLEPEAAELLEDKVLDAELRDEGVAFEVRDQGAMGDPGMNGEGFPA
ncbi:MAG: Fe-S cluster assembly protein HesB [Solirubrobacterales bacterium]|nr:Fe-S cluster assembly protein HesB [Solirubrobacterales bacterium]MBA3860502.1 Fe-S cluster assembly protein HesB [Solirubrobacterales bacterium]